MVAVFRQSNSSASSPGLNYEQALAACAHSLLTTDESSALEVAGRALLSATDAQYLFIDRNIDDPDLGFAATNVVTVSLESAPDTGLDVWANVPWSTMPAAREALSAGEVFMYEVETLDGSERAQHSDGLSDEVVKIPIMINDQWVGHMGIAGRGVAWSDDEVALLRAATQMVAAYWERQATRQRLESALEASKRQLKFQEALAVCARELLISSDDLALERAVDAMRDASGSWFGFLDVLEDDRTDGPTLVKLLTVVAPGITVSADDYDYWKRVPASRMPGAWACLQRGEAYLDLLGSMEGADRELYEDSPVPPQSSLKLPIHVDDELVGVVGFAHGGSHQQWMPEELALLEAGARMIAAYWQREANHSRLTELVASKDEFVAGVSHEIRTPLTAVVGLAQELRERRDVFTDEEIGEFVTLIAQQSTDVSHIVEDLLVAARADIDRVAIVAQPVQLTAELASAVAGLSHVNASRLEVFGGEVWVDADAARLRQVMRNLITNALRYGGERIQVQLSTAEGFGVLEVRDNGDGIAEEHRAAIFDAYQRAHDPKGQPASVGLGLTVSRSLARLMGGDVDYRFEDGWSVFRLSLPASPQTF